MTAITQALAQQLSQLAKLAQQTDDENPVYQQPLFDQQLFISRPTSMTAATLEAHKTLDSITKEQSLGILSTDRAQYLATRLVEQIEAIKKAIDCIEINQTTPVTETEVAQTTNQLYVQLEQHQEWERRLSVKVKEQQYAVRIASPATTAIAKKTLLKLEQRLERCIRAKTKIEQLLMTGDEESE
ncbi:primosomal replication protein PriC [Vibrio sp. SCSIO 43136]|uniref:primosomal replication protein PriC n=1 Tax=Vibrio sp. SCSIO 43136 TaxID=2819101 RepID=UPI0020760F2D|nr:primosomal replication protein PriC [Vibrio sp. SCSIO 43136]USD64362.1 primosomal replication protein [Vibrio sp. SCSIO 43136]